MNQKGFSTMIFILLIFILSGGIIGGSLYLAKTRNLAPKSTLTKNDKTDSLINDQVAKIVPGLGYTKPVTPDDGTASKNYQSVVDALTCHYSNQGIYPSDLTSIQTECTRAAGFNIIDSNTNNPFSYEDLVGGKAYTLKGVILTKGKFEGKEFYVTDFDNEFLKRKHDYVRASDFATLQQAINVTLEKSNNDYIFCNGYPDSSFPCSGSSNKDSLSIDGSGWVRINLVSQQNNQMSGIKLSSLPKDPLNNMTHHYSYCAGKTGWELNVAFESIQQSSKMKSDGGDDDNKYEIGTNLKLIDKVGNCRYQ